AGLGIRMLVDEPGSPGRAAKPDPKLIKLLARAHLFHRKLGEGSAAHLDGIAAGLGLTSSYLTRVLRLSYLAPDITRAILEAATPATSPRKSCCPIPACHSAGRSSGPFSASPEAARASRRATLGGALSN